MKCISCGKDFEPSRKSNVYCSTYCCEFRRHCKFCGKQTKGFYCKEHAFNSNHKKRGSVTRTYNQRRRK